MTARGMKNRVEKLERRSQWSFIVHIYGPYDTPEQRAEQARALADALAKAPPGTPVVHIDAMAI
jgi:hypothetical protein